MVKKTFKRLLGRDFLTVGLLVLLYAFFFIMLGTGAASNQFKSLIVPISYNVLLVASLNLMVGVLGELSLGHAGFMSVGAYAGCFFSVHLLEKFPSLPLYVYLPLAMLVGGLVASVFGVIIGIPALRVSGDYLAIVTLAFGEIIRNVIVNIEPLGGAIGYNTRSVVPRTNLQMTLLPYLAGAVILSMIVILNLVRSKHGRAIQAIRDNRIAAEACGINVNVYKVAVFAIAAFFAGIAGVLYGHSQVLLKSATFSYNMSIEILVMVVLGGMGNMMGSVFATIILTVLPEILRDFADYRMLIYSILLILIMLFSSAPAFARVRELLNLNKLREKIVSALKKKKKGGAENGTETE